MNLTTLWIVLCVLSTSLVLILSSLAAAEGQAFADAVGYVTLDSDAIMEERMKLNCDAIAPSTTTFTGVNEQFKYCRDRREVLQLGSSTVFPVANVFSQLVCVAVA